MSILKKLKKLMENDSNNNGASSESDDVVSDDLLNNKYASGQYTPYFDDFHSIWNVKDTVEGICYPMTSRNMAYVISILLNFHIARFSDVSNELYMKNCKFEELGYDLDDLDKELNLSP